MTPNLGSHVGLVCSLWESIGPNWAARVLAMAKYSSGRLNNVILVGILLSPTGCCGLNLGTQF